MGDDIQNRPTLELEGVKCKPRDEVAGQRRQTELPANQTQGKGRADPEYFHELLE